MLICELQRREALVHIKDVLSLDWRGVSDRLVQATAEVLSSCAGLLVLITSKTTQPKYKNVTYTSDRLAKEGGAGPLNICVCIYI